MTISPESYPSAPSILQAALDSIKSRYETAREVADATARRIGYDVTANPTGYSTEQVQSLRVEDAVANAIAKDLQLLGGFVTGFYVTPPDQDPNKPA